MNVFTDFHHTDLYHSLRLLFEKRLGWKLYRPVGFDWYKKGFWTYSPRFPIVRQYLKITDEYYKKKGIYYFREIHNNETQKCLTFEQFLKKDIDIIIASVANHEQPYFKLKNEYKPKAKLIRQQGNIHELVNFDIIQNLMASTAPFKPPQDVNTIFYHQEFDLNIFRYQPPKNFRKISNFMNCFPDSRDYYLWPLYTKELKEFEFKMYGILGKDGILSTTREIAKEMLDSTFIWHVKAGGDGFGHIIHNAFACGRPLITKIKYYKNTLAEPLLIDLKTCIDIENRDFKEVIKLIRYYSQPDKHKKMCDNVYQAFKSFVNFDYEFKEIKEFLCTLH